MKHVDRIRGIEAATRYLCDQMYSRHARDARSDRVVLWGYGLIVAVAVGLVVVQRMIELGWFR